MREEFKSCSTLSNLLSDKNTINSSNEISKAPIIQELSKQNNLISIDSIKGFPIYLLIIITILTNLFIAIILSPVLSIGIIIIILLIIIVSLLLVYIISELL